MRREEKDLVEFRREATSSATNPHRDGPTTTFYHLRTGTKMDKVDHIWLANSVYRTSPFLGDWKESYDGKRNIHFAIDVDFSKIPIEVGDYKIAHSREELFEKDEETMYMDAVRKVRDHSMFFYIGTKNIESVIDGKGVDKLSRAIVNRHGMYVDRDKIHESKGYVYCLIASIGPKIILRGSEDELFVMYGRMMETGEYFREYKRYTRDACLYEDGDQVHSSRYVSDLDPYSL